MVLAVVAVCGPVRHTGGVAACPVALRMSAVVSAYVPAVHMKNAAGSATGTEDANVSPTRAIMCPSSAIGSVMSAGKTVRECPMYT